tara:strand:+ start:475 stop:801 length:327 start_codon:yes stop_codon:yes gene_type:complete
MNEKQVTHTPGQWHAFKQVSYSSCKGMFEISKSHPCGYRQTVAVTPLAGDEKELNANARLIAAAPELLEHCKLFEKVLSTLIMEGKSCADLERDNLRAILDRVEGETA